MKKHPGSSLLLMELIAAVGLFAICAALCTGAFMKADRVSREARQLRRAVAVAQSAAELYHKGGEPALRRAYPEETADGFSLSLREARDGGVCTLTISLSEGETLVYTLETARLEG